MEDEEVEHPCHSLDIDDDETPLSPPPPSSSSSSSSSLSLLRRCNNQPSLSPRSTIPGPAAAIQAAMLRKTLSNSNSNSNSKQPLDSQISSQDRFSHDSEFDRDPWKFTLKSLTKFGVLDRTSLREIKSCANATRIKWVVAIVKSCTPNGLGDMRITLKDETDTVDATVQGKVLVAEDFGKWMTVGSVLILQKVVAFSSSYMSCYLNITRSNIVKVISVDCEVHSFSQAKPDSTPVLSGISETLERPSALVCRSERVIGDVNRSSSVKGSSTLVELAGKEHYTHPRSQNSSRQIENATDKILEEGVHIDLVDSGHTTFGCGYKSQGENLCRSSQPGPSSSEGIFRRLQNLNNDGSRQARECSSAPSIIENLGNQNWQASDGQAARLLQDNSYDVTTTENFGTFMMMPKNADDLDSCDVNDVRKQHNPRAGSSFAPGMVENLNKRGTSEFNGGRNTAKSLNRTESEAQASVVAEQDYEQCRGANSMKKQKVALISRTAIQEWTEEQLDILDMEDD